MIVSYEREIFGDGFVQAVGLLVIKIIEWNMTLLE